MLINVSFTTLQSFEMKLKKIALMSPYWENVTNATVPFWWGTDSSRANFFCSICMGWRESAYQNDRGKKSRVAIIELQFRIFESFVFSLLLMVVYWIVTKINKTGFYKIHSMKAQFVALMLNSLGLGRRLINVYFLNLDVF